MNGPQSDLDRSLRDEPSATSTVFRVLVLVLGGALVVAISLAIVTRDDAAWTPILALGALFLVAEHRDRVFPDETGLSGSIAVALASAVLFADRGWVGGALLCCVIGGAYTPHIRQRALAKIVVNAASFGFSALAAAVVIAVISPVSDGALLVSITLAAATATYWCVNCLLLALATAAISHQRIGSELVKIIRSDTVMLAFGFGGALCGVVMTEVGLWTGMATLVALLVALDVFVISVPAGLSVLRSAWAVVLARGLSGGVAGTVGAVVTRSVSISVLGAIAGLAAGLAAGVVVVVLIVGVRLLTLRRTFDPALVGGVALVELAFPVIGATAGVATAVAGLAAGLVVASALVVAGSIVVAVRRRRAERKPPPIDDDTALVAVVEALLEGRPAPTRER